MRRLIPLAAVAILALAAGCSKHDDTKVSGDLKDAGRDTHQAVDKLAGNADVKKAEVALKQAGHDAHHDLDKAAAEAKSAVRGLAADTRKAGHDVTHSSSKTDRDDKG